MKHGRFHGFGKGSLLLFIMEFVCLLLSLICAQYLVVWLNLADHEVPRAVSTLLTQGALFASLTQVTMMSMGLYRAKNRSSFLGELNRLIIALVFGFLLLTLVYYMFPSLRLDRGIVLPSVFIGLISLLALRRVSATMLGWGIFDSKVLILGAGKRASIVEHRMRRKADRTGVELVGFVKMPGDKLEHGVKNETVIEQQGSLVDFVEKNGINEIVVACDERRGMLSVQELFSCRMKGVIVTDILSFFECHTGQIAVDLMYPSWIIYNNGFQPEDNLRNSLDWVFNIGIAVVLLMLTWPLLLITYLAVFLEDGWRDGVFYRQRRIGMGGREFEIIKFRSMRVDAQKDGVQWAEKNDPRITRVGRFIRKYHIDELPQVFNILKGDMDFVGPRPEQPDFSHQLEKKLPYYAERHNVKPGLTGWAQLKYPYGASDEDAMEKLKYDLYYVKHRSFMMDFLIFLQTVEVVLFAKGSR